MFQSLTSGDSPTYGVRQAKKGLLLPLPARVSREVPRSILKFEMLLGTLDAPYASDFHAIYH